jgi:hypothetical protein
MPPIVTNQSTLWSRTAAAGMRVLSWLASPLGQLVVYFPLVLLLGFLVYRSVWLPLTAATDVSEPPSQVATMADEHLITILAKRDQRVTQSTRSVFVGTLLTTNTPLP